LVSRKDVEEAFVRRQSVHASSTEATAPTTAQGFPGVGAQPRRGDTSAFTIHFLFDQTGSDLAGCNLVGMFVLVKLALELGAMAALLWTGYARVHHDELASRVLDLMDVHPSWRLPLGYQDGEYGATLVPSGAYLGDRDLFLFLVDGNRDLDDPTDPTQSGLFRGFILRNSDVGAAALTLDLFVFRAVCGNHVIWGFQRVSGFRRRHIGASIQDAWTSSLHDVCHALEADPAHDRARLQRLTTLELGPTRDAVLETVLRRLDVSQQHAAEAYTMAEQFEANPRSVWGYVQGLTRLSQRTPWQDGRFALDRAASRLLTLVD
jgi:hypothetical protein